MLNQPIKIKKFLLQGTTARHIKFLSTGGGS